MLKRVKVTVALTAAASSAVLLMASQQAMATTAQGSANNPTADVVGVGSDTLQFAGDFLADGAPASSVGGLAVSGFNASGNKFRMINYDATGDSVGRGTYNSTGGQYYTDSPTTALVLRAKQAPVEIPDGSSNGIAALLNDSPGSGTNYHNVPNGSIQYARMSRIPKQVAEENVCAADSTGCVSLHPVAIGSDSLTIAQRDPSLGGSNAVALSGFQLAKIYQCSAGFTHWNDPGIGGTSSDTIVPIIPQTGSGTRNDFTADLTSHYGFSGTLGGCVQTAQEHDPDGIVLNPNAIDAIEPFSAARIALINSGYFANAGVAANKVIASSGTPSDTNPIYRLSRNMYITVRDADVNNSTAWQPGGANNWAKTLFVGGSSYLSRATGQADVTAAGFVGGYLDCGAADLSGSCPAFG